MRILRTIESFYPVVSGPANQAFKISQELEKRGIRSPILTSNYNAESSSKTQKICKVEVFRFPVRCRFMKYFVTPDMKKKLKDFDIIHAHNYRSYQTAISFKAAKSSEKPFVISVHGSLLTYAHYLKGLAKIPYIVYDKCGGKRIINDADAVIVNSKQEYQDAAEYGVKKEKVHIIPAGINIDEYSPLDKEENTLKILFVGRLSRKRNLEPIIKAAALLKKKIIKTSKKRIQFLIVGGEAKSSDTSRSGYLNELKQFATNLEVMDIIKFVGEKKGEELKKYYRTSDIFIYTSLSENFGQTILEAGAAGLPLICTKVGIAPEIINNNTNGFLIIGKPDEITERIIDLFDKKKRENFGKITREIIREKFNWDKILDKYVQIYHDIL